MNGLYNVYKSVILSNVTDDTIYCKMSYRIFDVSDAESALFLANETYNAPGDIWMHALYVYKQGHNIKVKIWKANICHRNFSTYTYATWLKNKKNIVKKWVLFQICNTKAHISRGVSYSTGEDHK